MYEHLVLALMPTQETRSLSWNI